MKGLWEADCVTDSLLLFLILTGIEKKFRFLVDLCMAGVGWLDYYINLLQTWSGL